MAAIIPTFETEIFLITDIVTRLGLLPSQSSQFIYLVILIFSLYNELSLVNATVTRSTTGKYIASILCETEIEQHPSSTSAVGLDLGIKTYLVTSNNDVIDNPKYYRTHQRKLRKANKKLSRSQKGSANRVKAKNKLARVHVCEACAKRIRIAAQREDFLQKLSTQLIRENAIICIEDLSVKNMAKNRKLAKSIMDCGWSMFVAMLEYKALWHDRVVQKVSRFYPSSQTCNYCGYVNPEVKDLEIREWTCPKCNSYHLRDWNAAIECDSFARNREIGG